MEILIYSLVFMPMVAAFLSFLLGRKTRQGRDLFLRGALVLNFILSLLLFASAADASLFFI
jgi:hypothetical protein